MRNFFKYVKKVIVNLCFGWIICSYVFKIIIKLFLKMCNNILDC